MDDGRERADEALRDLTAHLVAAHEHDGLADGIIAPRPQAERPLVVDVAAVRALDAHAGQDHDVGPGAQLVRHHDRCGPSRDRDIARVQLERDTLVSFDPG
ncbi:hypothetical protein APR04_005255 [Promicromonospora umidemergens]|uniref:Uncharacterized protein n=1 Tax=Promicromonospora umidemergens TaxID=629679 RepID=A0ABP8Y1L9_9MICO|nr:hypothetical protein [Promicromonospora umidemergens]MCP2286318.1 hypothetical protein [Promicromonospora umidemergens]